MADPASVLGALNLLFPMEQHAEMYFTIWYGVYDTTTRRLTYASAGQHPAFLAWPGGSAMSPLAARNPMIGAIPGRQYRSESIAVPPGALVYLFSDGVFEIRLEDGSMWDIDSFVTETLSPGREIFDECQRIYGAVRSKARGGELDDDFSLVIVRFPD
jgi:sigma-B regulation protein RsbU (phosphoserine phosphatase)